MAMISWTPLRIAGSSLTVLTSSFREAVLLVVLGPAIGGEDDIDIFLKTVKPAVAFFGLVAAADRDGLDCDLEMAPLFAEDRLFTLIFNTVGVCEEWFEYLQEE